MNLTLTLTLTDAQFAELRNVIAQAVAQCSVQAHQPAPAAKEWLNTKEAADYTCVSKKFLEQLRCTGGGPEYAKLARLVMYQRKDLDAWLVGKKVKHTAESHYRR